jgi:hypothetical protein
MMPTSLSADVGDAVAHVRCRPTRATVDLMTPSAQQSRSSRRARAATALVAGTVAALVGGAGAAPATASVATPAAFSAPAHRAPAAPTTIALPNGQQPEGITSGPGHRFYVGSLNDGRIVTGDLRGGPTRVLLPGSPGRQLRGLALDERSGLLWAVGNVGTVAHVYALDARSGHVVRDVVVAGGGFLNDLVVTKDAVWVTDSYVDRLTRIAIGHGGRPTSAAPTFVPVRGAWPTTSAGSLGANGVRTLAPGQLLLDNSTAGGLWAVSTRTGVATRVPVTGGPDLTGGDGVERRGSTVWVVRGNDNASVTQLSLRHSRSGWSARWERRLTASSLDVPSTATVVGDSLYAVNARFGVPSPATATYSVTRLPLGR